MNAAIDFVQVYGNHVICKGTNMHGCFNGAAAYCLLLPGKTLSLTPILNDKKVRCWWSISPNLVGHSIVHSCNLKNKGMPTVKPTSSSMHQLLHLCLASNLDNSSLILSYGLCVIRVQLLSHLEMQFSTSDWYMAALTISLFVQQLCSRLDYTYLNLCSLNCSNCWSSYCKHQQIAAKL